jgi:hypothetical protein
MHSYYQCSILLLFKPWHSEENYIFNGDLKERLLVVVCLSVRWSVSRGLAGIFGAGSLVLGAGEPWDSGAPRKTLVRLFLFQVVNPTEYFPN